MLSRNEKTAWYLGHRSQKTAAPIYPPDDKRTVEEWLPHLLGGGPHPSHPELSGGMYLAHDRLPKEKG